LASRSDAEAAAAIHEAGVQILVDLKGYTLEARPEIMALRPAPVQVSFIGYPGTMGAPFIDYLVADRFVVPGHHAIDYTEKMAILPGTYQINDRKRRLAGAPPRTELGLPPGAFVFCCFNQPYKILPEVFAAWMQILENVPHAVLWLLDWNSRATANLRREAERSAIDPRRLVFGPKLPVEKHLARIGAADLFLDTFPYGAHTTASDALWAGVPLLTRIGETFASRVAGSLLSAIGLPELITTTMAQYRERATALSCNPSQLAALRNKLRLNRPTAALFDSPRFTRHLETAYQEMWAAYAAGAPPGAIEVRG
jgi:predicted O-linked N-acetylglucosamine transferase (SPINDLY family)